MKIYTMSERPDAEIAEIISGMKEYYLRTFLFGIARGWGFDESLSIALEGSQNDATGEIKRYRSIEERDDVYTLDDFLETCKSGMFVDSDGSGHYAKEGVIYWADANPSDFMAGRINKEYTHVVWFNK